MLQNMVEFYLIQIFLFKYTNVIYLTVKFYWLLMFIENSSKRCYLFNSFVKHCQISCAFYLPHFNGANFIVTCIC
ncbi:unnamed protein product [Tenebrio molitor]|nr:unnamed protein product [Tenebrio molitor]